MILNVLMQLKFADIENQLSLVKNFNLFKLYLEIVKSINFLYIVIIRLLIKIHSPFNQNFETCQNLQILNLAFLVSV